MSRRAATPPSHRVTKPTNRRARERQGNEPTVLDAPPRMRCPDTVVFRPSPPLVARSLKRLAIRSGQSHPSLSTHPQEDWQRLKSDSLRAIRPPDRCGRVRTVRNSPSGGIACQVVVRRHTCFPVTRQSTRATQAQAAPGACVGQPAPKAPSKASHETRDRPEECLGWTSGRAPDLTQPQVAYGVVTNRHDWKVFVLIRLIFVS